MRARRAAGLRSRRPHRRRSRWSCPSVTDAGPGVDQADVASRFEPFRSGRNPGASGIGLAICKAVVDGHNGTIEVGGAPGGGASFTVRLPAG